jgi:hypothetical protein
MGREIYAILLGAIMITNTTLAGVASSGLTTQELAAALSLSPQTLRKRYSQQPPVADLRAANACEDPIILALEALLPGKRCQKSELFSRAFPGILSAIARKVPQKEILAVLATNGLKLHPVRYRELLEMERKLRDERGELICCKSCGAPLDRAVAETMANRLARVEIHEGRK